MFPKHTVTTSVAIPAEKPPIKTAPATGQKHTAVVFVVDNTDIQVAVDNDRKWRIKRAAICACVFLLTVLILVAGTLGAIAIVSVHNGRLRTSEPEPSIHVSALGNALPTLLSISTQRLKISDGGLWLAEPPLDVDYVTVNDADSEIVSAPLTPSSDSSSYPDSSSSSEEDYNMHRNWVSSSFPYQGYYMHGEVGIPPWEQSNWVDPSMAADPYATGNSRPSDASEDGAELSGVGVLSDQEYGDVLDVDYVTAVDDADSDIVSAPLTSSSDSSSYPDYSSSSEEDYNLHRNSLSSSFPDQTYDIYGEVGPSMADPSTTGNSRPSDASGDGAEFIRRWHRYRSRLRGWKLDD